MFWKKLLNFVVLIILTFAYFVVTMLNIFGPLQVNAFSKMQMIHNRLLYSIVYLLVALGLTWGAYFRLYQRPKRLLFTLLILGIILIFIGTFLWRLAAS